MRLNGWHRLWVVLSVLWAVFTVAVGINVWPRPAVVPTNEHLESLPSWFSQHPTPPDIIAGEAAGKYPRILDKDYQSLLQQIASSGAESIDGLQKLTPTERARILELQREQTARTEATIRSNLAQRQRQAVSRLFLSSIVPIIVFYAIGWSVAWIRRGFQQP
jgi:hypothetical protein